MSSCIKLSGYIFHYALYLLTNTKDRYNIKFTHKHTNNARNLHTYKTHTCRKLEWVRVRDHLTQ